MRSKCSKAKSPGHDERSISRTSTGSPGLSSIRTSRGDAWLSVASASSDGGQGAREGAALVGDGLGAVRIGHCAKPPERTPVQNSDRTASTT
jgi:hypothetical protein